MREFKLFHGRLSIERNDDITHSARTGIARVRFASRALRMAVALAPACSVSVGHAQDSERASSQVEEVIVTGTFLRGAEPAGTNVIGITSAEVQETGATTTAQLLQTIPQFGAFNTLSFPVGAGNSVTTNRPNLRSLPGFNNSGGSTTLVLMDGHRIVGAGVTATSPDPDIIPPGVVERVEIVPDGGSAIYGSDAVAGVINFITLKQFEGLKLDARYGVGDAYDQADANVTAGIGWENGGAYLSYNYSEHDSILGRERDYVHEFPSQVIGGVPVTTIQCSPGNVVQGGRIFALPFDTTTGSPPAVVGSANQCDSSNYATVYPKEYRHSVLGSLSQQLTDSIKFDVKGFFTKREIDIVGGPYRFTQSVAGPASSIFFSQHNVGANQSVSGQFGELDSAHQNIGLETWGVTPTLTADLGSNWQLRVLGSSSRSTTTSDSFEINPTAMTRATSAGLFNPYDPSTSDPAALAAMTNYEVYGETEQRLDDARAVLDGSLLNIPGGAIKLAIGGEYYREHFDTRKGGVVPGYAETGYPGLIINGSEIIPAMPAAPAASLSRSVSAAFAEVVVPIFSEENGRPGLRELTVSAAGRYDDYSDVGHTFNPKFGLTYKPFESIKLRASWGESFVAPSLADAKEAELTQLLVVPAAAFAPPPNLVQNGTYPPVVSGQFVIGARGNSPGIGPQEAETVSVGIDIEPTSTVNIGLTYYRIDFQGVIGLPPVGGAATATLYRDYPFLIQAAPTLEQINELVAAADIPASLCTPLPNCVYAILDIRKRNLGNFKLDGIDVSANYHPEMSFGSLFFGVNGTYELHREQSAAADLPYSDLLDANNSRYRLRTTAGVEVGNLLGQLIWNHTAGYDLNPSAGFIAPLQTKVEAFDVVNLFFRYDVNGNGMFEDLAFTLNVDNMLDQEPPEFRGVTSTSGSRGFINGNTLGRLFQIGIEKQF